MVFRNLIRNISMTLNHKARRLLTSNFEVFKEIPAITKPTLSEIETDILNSDEKSKNNQIHINQIFSFFNSKQSLKVMKDIIPALYIIKTRSLKDNKRILLADKDVACDIFKVLWPYFENYNGHVIEINAGAGVLTEELLKVRLKNLRIYEPDATLCNHLLKLINVYKSDARLFMANLLVLGSLIKLDTEYNEGRIETLFDGLPSLPWEEEPVVRLVGALPSERFILHIMLSIILQNGICEFGRPELFLIFSPEEYKKLKSIPSDEKMYKSSSVMFQILFDHEELTRVPEHVFIPWCSAPRSKRRNNQPKENCDYLCLVKLTPKKDLLQTIPPDLLRSFWFFVKFMMHKKSSLLIEKMENWVPGSGVRLISKGYTIFTDCGSLTPKEYLNIYLEFTSWPEFRSSSFLPYVEGLYEKLLSNPLEDVVSDEKFSRLLKKESNVSVDDDDDFDDSINLDHNEQNVTENERGRV